MQRLLSLAAIITWGLWFGGVIALFIFVTALFAADRVMATDAAPVLFVTFEKAQLVFALALVAILAAWAWLARSGWVAAALAAVLLASGLAMAMPLTVTNRMEDLRRAGRSSSAEFRRLHGISSSLYVAEASLLLGAGLLLPPAIARRSRGDDRRR